MLREGPVVWEGLVLREQPVVWEGLVVWEGPLPCLMFLLQSPAALNGTNQPSAQSPYDPNNIEKYVPH